MESCANARVPLGDCKAHPTTPFPSRLQVGPHLISSSFHRLLLSSPAHCCRSTLVQERLRFGFRGWEIQSSGGRASPTMVAIGGWRREAMVAADGAMVEPWWAGPGIGWRWRQWWAWRWTAEWQGFNEKIFVSKVFFFVFNVSSPKIMTHSLLIMEPHIF